jgi:hypothetical protein
MKINTNKKASEMNQQLLITVLFIAFAISLIFFAARSCTMIDETYKKVSLADLEADIKSAVTYMSSRHGLVEKFSFKLPQDIDTICMLDLNKSNIILNTTLSYDYPLINDSLYYGNDKNMFLIQEHVVAHQLNVGNLCFDHYPYYSCINTPSELLYIWFEGKNGCATLYIDWEMFGTNTKNENFYQGDPLFIIQDERGVNDYSITNWREMLSIIPLTLYKQEEETKTKNFNILYEPTGVLNQSQLEYLMDEHDTSTTYFYNTTYSEGSTGEYDIQVKSTKTIDYFDAWNEINSIIMVDYNNTEAGLIAALLAAYVNAPLLFIDDNNLNYYKGLIVGKKIFVVTHGTVGLDTKTYEFVQEYASFYSELSDTLLGIEGTVPAFAKLYSEFEI